MEQALTSQVSGFLRLLRFLNERIKNSKINNMYISSPTKSKNIEQNKGGTNSWTKFGVPYKNRS